MGTNITEEYKGCWVIVEESSNKYIGRVESANTFETTSKNDFLEYWKTHSIIQLCPVFQYISRLVPKQTEDGVILARDSAVLPYDLTLNEKQNLYTKPVTVTFFEDMSGTDRSQYETLINRCGDMMIQSRLSQSGLTMATQMPPRGAGSLIRK